MVQCSLLRDAAGFRATPGGAVTRLFGTSGSALVAPDRVCVGQRGVHGVALDPAFATNRTVYDPRIVIQAWCQSSV
jgi:hypothetical protein